MVKFESRNSLGYGRVLACLRRNIGDIVQSQFRTISPPSYVAAPLNISRQGVKVLCLGKATFLAHVILLTILDGGGVRGLSSLLILKNIMYSLKRRRGLRDIPKPCDIFDVIAGTSTGG